MALSLAMSVLKPTEFANANNFLDILANAALPAILAFFVLVFRHGDPSPC